jgi:lipopolysaccharide biosynthesis protein
VQSFEVSDPRPFGFDAAMEFPPHRAAVPELTDEVDILNPGYEGRVLDYRTLVEASAKPSTSEFPLFPGVMPGWDNEPRRPGRGWTFIHSDPASYARWLKNACTRAAARPAGAPPLVFVNAWNEWAEGAHLEPDRRFGYGYLHATANVLRDFARDEAGVADALLESQRNFRRRSDVAVLLHLFYDDLAEELARRYLVHLEDADLFVSCRFDLSAATLERLRALFPRAYFARHRNRGRDVYPFLELLRVVDGLGYPFACKLHTKRSAHRADGAAWRAQLLGALAGDRRIVDAILSRFRSEPSLGFVAPQDAMTDLSERDFNIGNRRWLDTLLARLGRPELAGSYRCRFAAGSMFWFKVPALRRLLNLGLGAGDFEDEVGQLDGTLAHALERLFVVAAEAAGYATAALE